MNAQSILRRQPPRRPQDPTTRGASWSCGWQRRPHPLDGPENLVAILRRLQPGREPRQHAHPARTCPAFTKSSADVRLQEIKMFAVVRPQKLATAVLLEPQRKPEVGICQFAESTFRRKTVLGQPAGKASQTPHHPAAIVVLGPCRRAKHDRALAARRTSDQYVVGEPFHPHQRVLESVTNIPTAVHQTILPQRRPPVRRIRVAARGQRWRSAPARRSVLTVTTTRDHYRIFAITCPCSGNVQPRWLRDNDPTPGATLSLSTPRSGTAAHVRLRKGNRCEASSRCTVGSGRST